MHPHQDILGFPILIIVLITAFTFVRLYVVLTAMSDAKPSGRRGDSGKCSLAVFLGSGPCLAHPVYRSQC